MKYILSSLVFLVFGLGGVTLFLKAQPEKLYRFVCDKVQKEYYKESEQLVSWYEFCLDRSKEISKECSILKSDCLVDDLNRVMGAMGVSHLYMTEPIETQAVYYHIGQETGMRVRILDGEFVVTRLLSESPALAAKIQKGDVLLAKDGIELQSTSDAQSAGEYLIRRGERQWKQRVDSATLEEDMRPKLTRLTGATALLSLPSYEGEYQEMPLFDRDAWKELVGQFDEYDHLIIDLRDNAGGNFAAMLRSLSPFFCKPTRIGSIVKKRTPSTEETFFPDELGANLQIETLERNASIQLVTYKGYGCYQGKVTVLIDAGTASAAEIFAEAIKVRPHSRVWGHPSSGSVLVAKREELMPFGEGYVLTIPVAAYESINKKDLEEGGVEPQKIIHYEKSDALKGIDSWIHLSTTTAF